MPFWDKLKRKKTNVPSGKELSKGVTQIPFENFLADLISSGKNYLIKLNRIGTKAAGDISGTIPVNTISPSTFTETVSEQHGGGSYEVRFMDHDQGDALVMRKDDPHRPVMYVVNVAGEPKGGRKGESKEKGLTVDLPALVQAVFKPEVMTGFAALWNALTGQTDKRPDPAAMMQQITQTLVQLKQLAPDPEMPNPIAMIESLLGVIQKMADQMKPPPTTQGAGGFWDGIGKALAGPLTNAIGGGAPQLTQGSPGFAGTAQTQRTGQTSQTQQTGEPDAETVNPLQVLRSMVSQRANPEEVAAYAVEAIDTYTKFSSGEIPYQYRGLLENPGAAIDFLLTLVPNVDPAYGEQVKSAAVRYVEAWKAQNQPPEAQEGINAEDFQTPDTQQEPDAEDAGDGKPGPDDADAGTDEAG